MIVLSWLGIHLSCIILLFGRKKTFLVACLVIVLFLLIYVFKNDTYDLFWYKEYFASGASYHELLFDLSSSFLFKVFKDANYVVGSFFVSSTVLYIILFSMLFDKKSFPLKHGVMNIVFVVLVAWGSVFFVVTTQNGIRQGLALLFIMISVVLWNQRSFLLSMCLCLLGIGFHWSAGIFFILGLFVLYMSNMKLSSKNNVSTPSITLYEIIVCITCLLIALYIQSQGFIYTDASSFTEGRTPSWLKALALAFVFFVSEFVLGRIVLLENFNIRRFRRMLFFAIMGFAILPEAFARILYFYYLVDSLFIAWALNNKRLRTKMAGMVIFISYGVAPNVIHIIGG